MLNPTVKKEMMERFECVDCGKLNEYVGSRIERTEGQIKLTQDVIIQSLEDEFRIL